MPAFLSTLLLKDSAEAGEQEELVRLREEAAERRKELEAVEVSIEDDGCRRLVSRAVSPSWPLCCWICER